jgi:hypothetical protein
MLHSSLSFGSIGLPALEYGVFTRNTAPRINQTQLHEFRPNVMAVTSFWALASWNPLQSPAIDSAYWPSSNWE